MRQSLFLAAALAAFMTLVPGSALAFDLQTLSGANPDGSANYSDPDEKSDKAPLGAMGGVTVTPGAQFGKGGASPSVPSYDTSADNGWQHLAPLGRFTH